MLKHRDWSYLRTWMEQGYAIVASDYVGLGTPGLMPYLDGRATAHSVVDMVKAGRAFTSGLAPRLRLARRWVTIGQSQGGGASIYTARYASEYGGPGLDFRGAVGTGTPAYIEDYVMLLGPEVPPVTITPSLAAYLTYIIASLRDVHPELGINGILTEKGKKYVAMSETMCDEEFAEAMEGVAVGEFFTAPMASLPDIYPTLKDYMGMPEEGFDTPVLHRPRHRRHRRAVCADRPLRRGAHRERRAGDVQELPERPLGDDAGVVGRHHPVRPDTDAPLARAPLARLTAVSPCGARRTWCTCRSAGSRPG